VIVTFIGVRDQTSGAILHTGLQHPKVPPTFLKKIERTIAEKTVEFFRPARFVTGEILAFDVAEKSVTVFHDVTSG